MTFPTCLSANSNLQNIENQEVLPNDQEAKTNILSRGIILPGESACKKEIALAGNNYCFEMSSKLGLPTFLAEYNDGGVTRIIKASRAILLCRNKMVFSPYAKNVSTQTDETLSPDEYFQKAYTLIDEGNPDNLIEAKKNILKALKKDNNNPYYYYLYGVILVNQNLFSQALYAFRKSISFPDIEKDFIEDAPIAIGVCLGELKKYDEALEIFKSLTMQNPNDYRYHICAGVVFENLGNLDEALASYKKADLLETCNSTCENLIKNVLLKIAHKKADTAAETLLSLR